MAEKLQKVTEKYKQVKKMWVLGISEDVGILEHLLSQAFSRLE